MRRTVIKMRAAAVLLGAGLIMSLTWLPTASATTQMTATVGVNIRAGAGTQTSVLGGLYRGQTVTVISSSQGWTKIKFAGSTAYVASRYLSKGADLPAPKKIGAGTVKVTTTALNLRTGPGLSYQVIKVLKDGARVTMTGKTARGWAQLVSGKSTGWSSMQYLASSSSGKPKIIGKRVATADLDIRTTSGANAKTVAEVKKGTALSVTGATQNGRAQIIYRGAVRWVTAKYLTNLSSNQPALPKLPKITGSRYATATLNIRSTYTDKYKLITEVPRGTKLSITGVVKNGQHADRLREGRPLGDCQVPLEVGAELNATELAGGRERAQAECDQGPSRSAGEVPADHDVLHLAGRRVHRPFHRSGT